MPQYKRTPFVDMLVPLQKHVKAEPEENERVMTIYKLVEYLLDDSKEMEVSGDTGNNRIRLFNEYKRTIINYALAIYEDYGREFTDYLSDHGQENFFYMLLKEYGVEL